MESYTPAFATSSKSPRQSTTSAPASPSAEQSQLSGPLEHEESPLRKRPRLDSTADQPGVDTEMRSDTDPPPPPQPSTPDRSFSAPETTDQASSVPDVASQQNGPPLTPSSRVTLNLRSAADTVTASEASTAQPSSPHQMITPNPELHTEDMRTDSPSSSLSEHSLHVPPESPVPSDQDNVVEIITTESDDEASVRHSVLDPTDVSFKLQLLDQFPLAREEGFDGAAMAIVELLIRNEIEAEIILQASHWISEVWLKHYSAAHQVPQPYEFKTQSFWNSVANIYGKLLYRKSHFGSLVPDGPVVPHMISRKLTDIYQPYLRLCTHLAAVDLSVISSVIQSGADLQNSELYCARHFKNVGFLFKNFSSVPLLRSLWENFSLQADVWLHKLLSNFMKTDRDGIHNLTALCTSLTSSPAIVSTYPNEVHSVLLVIRNMSRFLRDSWHTNDRDEALVSAYQSYSQPWLRLTGHIETLLDGIAEKQSGVTQDLCFFLLESAALILDDLASIDVLPEPNIAEPESVAFEDIPRQELPRLLMLCLYLRVCWRFIAKGRMELRIGGVQSLSTQLVSFWREMTNFGTNANSPSYGILARWIVNQKLVQYLVGVDTHPQLIARSQDIVGFVMVTKQWNQSMTDAIWDTIGTSPDPRVISGTLDMLGKIIHLADPDVVSAFCDKIDNLKDISLIPGMQNLLEKLRQTLVDMLRSRDLTIEVDRQRPLMLFVRIICDTAINPAQHPSSSSGANANATLALHSMALNSLQQLSAAANDSEGRKSIYKSCFEDIKGQSSRCIGCIESILALFSAHETQDRDLVLVEMDLLRRVAEEICSFVDEQKRENPEQPFLIALHSRLQLLVRLLSATTDPSLDPGIEERLWNHLVGKDAFNDYSRDQAWRFLVDIVRNCRKEDRLIERCINDFIWQIPPSLYSPVLFTFVQESMQYTQRVHPPPSPKDDEAVLIPLADMLWKIILQAPDNSIEHYASTLLSQHHLDTSIIKQAPMARVAATHVALINRCLSQLKDAVHNLGTKADEMQQDEPIPVSAFSSIHTNQDELCFIRTLQFLKRFTVEVRARPIFRDQDMAAESPILEAANTQDLKDHPAEIKFQAFKPGSDQGIRSLKIGASATIADLADRLRQKTGIRRLRLILAGSSYSLEHHADDKVETIQDKGLLIVLNDGSRKGSASSSPKVLCSSVAEQTLLNNFDTFYDFLGLDEKLSANVLHFMLDFPPHDRIKDLVLANNQNLEALFPKDNRVKAIYSAKCIKEHLIRQVHESPDDDNFILKGTHVLTSALVLPQWIVSWPGYTFDEEILGLLVDCLAIFLKQRPVQQSIASFMVNESAVVDRLFSMLEYASRGEARHVAYDCSVVYGCLLEASLQNNKVWQAFANKPNLRELHFWLLIGNVQIPQRQAIQNSIESIFTYARAPEMISLDDLVNFFWNLLKDLISRSASKPLQCREGLATLKNLFLNHQVLSHDQDQLRELFTSWKMAFASHVHADEGQHGRRDEFVYGICKLLSLCISFIKQFKKPIGDTQLIITCFDRYLFPPPSNTYNQEPELSSNSVTRPVLCPETRKELYSLALATCDNPEGYQRLVRRIHHLMEEPNNYLYVPPPVDISRWLRSATGYAGLTNLTNTCYMNSLLAQLFMNDRFRRFMLSAKVSDPRDSQKLLYQTQLLFANMQNSVRRYAQTEDFTAAIQPYEGDHVDISVQMDVDELYNLLFDRWETQMLSPADKNDVKSFYGGQVVTQIKSKDCEHVSENVEPIGVISLEVKGKSSLTESLHAYIEADTMEGVNKYKCESCGGKFVDAIRRSCIKSLPDDLIIHLKRFEWDFSVNDRFKINDEFEFPSVIDMKEFKIDFLNNPNGSTESDRFELVGVLVHNGHAESGHYYSYIRLPQITPNNEPAWAEFNDTEVTDFDPQKIPEQCFGGSTNHGEFIFPKQYNAYMLFYRRVSVAEAEMNNARLNAQNGPNQFTTDHSSERMIQQQNEILLRRYCRFDSTHSHFIKNIISRCKDMDGGGCSEGHEREHELLSMGIDHAKLVLTLVKDVSDLEATVQLLRKFVSSCAHCAVIALESIFRSEYDAQDLLLAPTSAKARLCWTDLIISLLKVIQKYDPQQYGIDNNGSTTEASYDGNALQHRTQLGVFYRVIQAMEAAMPILGRYIRSWDEYFGLWSSICNLGVIELGVVLSDGVLLELLQILGMPESKQLVPGRLRETHDFVLRCKRHIPRLGLVKVLRSFFAHINPFSIIEDHMDFTDRFQHFAPESGRFSITRQESAWIFQTRVRPNDFFTRILDAWEVAPDFDVCAPADIVSETMTCITALAPQASARVIHSVANSLALLVDEYHTFYASAVLQACLAFCRHCPNPDDAKRIVEKAAESAESIKELKQEPQRTTLNMMTECSPQGGKHFLDFFSNLMEMSNATCASAENPYPFSALVITLIPKWAPSLLMFDIKEVRVATVSILEHLIFVKYPYELIDLALTGDGSESWMDDLRRIRATWRLFDACVMNVHRAMQLRLGATFVQPSVSILAQCASWCDKLLREEDSTKETLQTLLDSSTGSQDPSAAGPDLIRESKKVVERWREFEPRLREWTYETDADEVISDTEWGSSGDDLSEGLTDN